MRCAHDLLKRNKKIGEDELVVCRGVIPVSVFHRSCRLCGQVRVGICRSHLQFRGSVVPCLSSFVCHVLLGKAESRQTGFVMALMCDIVSAVTSPIRPRPQNIGCACELLRHRHRDQVISTRFASIIVKIRLSSRDYGSIHQFLVIRRVASSETLCPGRRWKLMTWWRKLDLCAQYGGMIVRAWGLEYFQGCYQYFF